PIRGWRASANYTYLDTDVTDSGGLVGQTTFPQGQPLIRRPRHSGSISVGYQQDRLSAEATLYVKGASIDLAFSQPGSPRVNLPGHHKPDLALASPLSRHVVGLRDTVWKALVQNLLNEDCQGVRGFSSPRISALTGIEVRY